MINRKNKDQINIFQNPESIEFFGLHDPKNTLPVLNSMREESQHALNIIDSLVDKLLDLAKLLITVSAPALVILYSYSSNSGASSNINLSTYIILTLLIFIAGILLVLFCMWYKLKYLPIYLKSSLSRINVYVELISKNLDIKTKKK